MGARSNTILPRQRRTISTFLPLRGYIPRGCGGNPVQVSSYSYFCVQRMTCDFNEGGEGCASTENNCYESTNSVPYDTEIGFTIQLGEFELEFTPNTPIGTSMNRYADQSPYGCLSQSNRADSYRFGLAKIREGGVTHEGSGTHRVGTSSNRYSGCDDGGGKG